MDDVLEEVVSSEDLKVRQVLANYAKSSKLISTGRVIFTLDLG